MVLEIDKSSYLLDNDCHIHLSMELFVFISNRFSANTTLTGT